MIKKILLAFLILVVSIGVALFFLARKPIPSRIEYGMSFNAPYAEELGLDPLVVLRSFQEDLGVKHFRLAAHWPLIEPHEGGYDFTLMDEEMRLIEKGGGTVILGVGRRLPRWPECHIPQWAQDKSWEEQKNSLRKYIKAVVERYKDSPALTYWQVENEPYLSLFAQEECGPLDEAFLEEEIALVKSIDSNHPILITDSGNLGTWKGAYSHGDAFGTSVYVYFWNPELGQFKSILPPWFYRAKERALSLWYGKKPTFLIELSLEPWLIEPIQDTPIDVQFSRMNPEKFDEIIRYAKETRYDVQYLWGGEWWYWLNEKGHQEFWDKGKRLFEK